VARGAATLSVVVGAAHVISGADISKRLKEVDAKIGLLLAYRRIDQMASDLPLHVVRAIGPNSACRSFAIRLARLCYWGAAILFMNHSSAVWVLDAEVIDIQSGSASCRRRTFFFQRLNRSNLIPILNRSDPEEPWS
jgi:hypothetical protein